MNSSIPIVCPYCGVGCNLEMQLDDQGVPVKGKASGRNEEVNHKYLCVKGLAIQDFINNEERLTQPAIRKNGTLNNVSWEEAISETARRLKEVIDTYGPESVGMLSSSKILNEETYLCQKFQRQVVGSNNIDNCARLCHGPSEAGLRQQLGYGATSLFFKDFEKAETYFLTGAHTTFTHPIVWLKVKKNLKREGTQLVLADPRKTDLVKSAQIHLPTRPGTDIYWINALCKIIIDKGMADEEFCKSQTLGYEALKQSLADIDVDKACDVAGVSRQDLDTAAQAICGKRTIFIWGMGLTQHAHGTDNVHALTNLALLTGNIGKPGTGVAPLRGQNNVQGACDMGALPNLLPGHMLVEDEAARVHMEAIWGGKLSDIPGLSAPEMLHGVASGKIRALYVVGENPVVSEPQSTFASWMLQRLDLLVVQDVFPTETAKHAHVVLPATVVGEKAGIYTNAMRRMQYTADGIVPPGQARDDWQILTDVARAMGVDWDYQSTEDIWEEIRQAAPNFTGVTHDRLKNSKGLFWPCYAEDHEGTPRLYEDGFYFRDRRARFIPVPFPKTLMQPTETYPFVLITGRLLEHFNTGEMSRRARKLTRITGHGFMEMNPEDMEANGFTEGDMVRVTSPFGSVQVAIKPCPTLGKGFLFAPIHFSDPNVNSLMSAVPLDPKARMPALKVVPVSVEA